MTAADASAPVLRRVGMFGGAFDPPHLAHVALARLAVAQLKLDELRIFPTGHAWHKRRPLSAPEHRLAMARLAFGGLPRVVVDEREMLRAGPTYTIDTLEALQAEEAAKDGANGGAKGGAQGGCQLFLVIGADQAAALTQWHRFADILQIAIICVAGRAPTTSAAGQIDAELQPAQPDGRPEPWALAGRFERLYLPPMAVSATRIRQQVAAGLGSDDLVSTPVARYIAQHHLYREP